MKADKNIPNQIQENKPANGATNLTFKNVDV